MAVRVGDVDEGEPRRLVPPDGDDGMGDRPEPRGEPLAAREPRRAEPRRRVAVRAPHAEQPRGHGRAVVDAQQEAGIDVALEQPRERQVRLRHRDERAGKCCGSVRVDEARIERRGDGRADVGPRILRRRGAGEAREERGVVGFHAVEHVAHPPMGRR